MEYLNYFLHCLDSILEIFNTKKNILSLILMLISSLVTLLLFEVNNRKLKREIRDLKRENEQLSSQVFSYELRETGFTPVIIP